MSMGVFVNDELINTIISQTGEKRTKCAIEIANCAELELNYGYFQFYYIPNTPTRKLEYLTLFFDSHKLYVNKAFICLLKETDAQIVKDLFNEERMANRTISFQKIKNIEKDFESVLDHFKIKNRGNRFTTYENELFK